MHRVVHIQFCIKLATRTAVAAVCIQPGFDALLFVSLGEGSSKNWLSKTDTSTRPGDSATLRHSEPLLLEADYGNEYSCDDVVRTWRKQPNGRDWVTGLWYKWAECESSTLSRDVNLILYTRHFPSAVGRIVNCRVQQLTSWPSGLECSVVGRLCHCSTRSVLHWHTITGKGWSCSSSSRALLIDVLVVFLQMLPITLLV